MAERARAGRSVVRLKGGDPFVFGRGGEEAEALAAAGVPFEVVPGVTAGVAAAAYAGIPLTHREDASAVAFVTGHEDPAKDDSALDWDALARFPGRSSSTWGSSGCPRWPSAWSRRGATAASRRLCVERGTMPGQRTVTATLAELPAAVAAAAIGPPAIVLIGPVAARRETIAWLERRPLHGSARRRHTGARPGQRPGRGAARAGRRGGRAAGDPDRPAARLPRRFATRCSPFTPTRWSA